MRENSTKYPTYTLSDYLSVSVPSVHIAGRVTVDLVSDSYCRDHSEGNPAARLLLEVIFITSSILLVFINNKDDKKTVTSKSLVYSHTHTLGTVLPPWFYTALYCGSDFDSIYFTQLHL